MTYRYLTPALLEATEAAEYYETQVFGLGADFLDELDAAIQRIIDFPKAWGIISGDCRHCSLHRFPYTVIYEEESPEEILIVSVFHQHREPLSWKRNL
ncbi:MAG TPA: type II toxin-antitoxin system RelE/ParE family toxin [Bacteroidia bacterium]|nr:type II toxin-antitoxin system RelE/ParE family toxin [Bacteroidia bacterium]